MTAIPARHYHFQRNKIIRSLDSVLQQKDQTKHIRSKYYFYNIIFNLLQFLLIFFLATDISTENKAPPPLLLLGSIFIR